MQRKHIQKITSFDRQNSRVDTTLKQSEISKASDHLALGFNTILPFDLFEAYPSACKNHLMRIADYVELGQGHWYSIEGRNLVFHDGKTDPDTREAGPPLTSFRYVLVLILLIFVQKPKF